MAAAAAASIYMSYFSNHNLSLKKKVSLILFLLSYLCEDDFDTS